MVLLSFLLKRRCYKHLRTQELGCEETGQLGRCTAEYCCILVSF